VSISRDSTDADLEDVTQPCLFSGICGDAPDHGCPFRDTAFSDLTQSTRRTMEIRSFETAKNLRRFTTTASDNHNRAFLHGRK